MRKIYLLILISIILISSVANASLISSHDISVELDNGDVAHVESTVTYERLTTEKISYLVFAEISKVEVKDSKRLLDCVIEIQNYGTQISCIPGSYENNYTVYFEFDAMDVIRKSANAFKFDYDVSTTDPTKKFSLKLYLPERAFLVKPTEAFTPYQPETATIGSTGRQILLEWIYQNPELGKTYTFTATFEKMPIIKEIHTIYLLIVGFLAGSIFFLWTRKQDKGETVFSVLKSDEKEVLDVIIDKKGSCKQREVVRETDFSKAKVSRIIDDLVERGIIRKERMGRTNKLEVTDKSILKRK